MAVDQELIEELRDKICNDVYHITKDKKFFIEIKFVSPEHGDIKTSHHFEYENIESRMIKCGKQHDYKIFKSFYKTDENINELDNLIKTFDDKELDLFCKYFYSIKNYDDISETVNMISGVRNIVFLKKLEEFKPSTMLGKAEFLTAFLVKDSQRSINDITLAGIDFNIKHTEKDYDEIRPGKHGIHTSYNFWNNGVHPAILSICDNNSNGAITKNYNLIPKEIKDYFKKRLDENRYHSEFNKQDLKKMKEVFSYIEMKEYDVKMFETDLQKHTDDLTKGITIQYTNDRIIINGQYEYSRITQGRLRPVLIKSQRIKVPRKARTVKPKIVK